MVSLHPAESGPVALRPPITRGLPLSFKCYFKNTFLKDYKNLNFHNKYIYQKRGCQDTITNFFICLQRLSIFTHVFAHIFTPLIFMIVFVGLNVFFISSFPELIIPAPFILPRRLLSKAFEIIRILQAPLLLIQKLALTLTFRAWAYLLAWPVFTWRKFVITDRAFHRINLT